MVLGLVYYSVTNGWDGLIFSAEGLALGIALFLIPYIMGGMGAGDAKLMGAMGAIIGPKGVVIASLFTAVAGGIYALIVFLFNMQYFKGFIERSALTVKVFAFTRHFIPIPADESEKKPRLCYGVAIAVGTLSYVFLIYHGYKFPV
jgi:prepilin peptidase CpaA